MFNFIYDIFILIILLNLYFIFGEINSCTNVQFKLTERHPINVLTCLFIFKQYNIF